MNLIKKLCYIFPRRQRWQFVGLFLLQLIETFLDFFSISLILPFIDILINPDALGSAGWYRVLSRMAGTTNTSSVLLLVTVLMMVLYIVKNGFVLFLLNLRTRFIGANKIKMGTRMITGYMNRPYTFHLQRNTAEIIRSINGDVNGTFQVVSGIFSLISDVLIVITLAVYLFAVSFALTLGVLLALLVCSGVYFLFVRKKLRTFGQQNRKAAARMYKAIHQSMGGIKEVKLMGREAYFADAYEEAGTESVRIGRRYAVTSAIPGRLIETLCMCAILGILAVEIAAGTDLATVVPSLSAFAVAAIRLMPRANSMNANINTITYNMPSLDALYDDLTTADREEAERIREAQEKKLQRKPVHAGQAESIFVRNVTYTYPDKTAPVLKNVSLTIAHGSSVGIIGATGAGKTTLVDLILGLLRPDSGTVCYGGMDIHEDYAQWQKHIGYIPQTIYLIDDTIRKNVAMGIAEDEIDEQAIWRALEQAQLAEFVRGLDKGLETVVGERGVRISGGQRQRLGIARALYYDPEILFFDEATSSLDNQTEEAVMASVNALGRKKTLIIVAHRLSTLKGCDRIFRVDETGVTETKLED